MGTMQNVVLPDIGGHAAVDVIELLVKPGDKIGVDTPLITLESDKATMEIPSSVAGTVSSLAVKLGDKISEGDIILVVDTETTMPSSPSAEAAAVEKPALVEEAPTVIETPAPIAPPPQQTTVPLANIPAPPPEAAEDIILAGPAVRRLARVLGVALRDVVGSGRKSRIDKEDIERYVKERLTNPSAKLAGIAATPIDFSKFGEIERQPLSKLKRLTGITVQQSWTTVPLVTHFDNADITDLEAFRQSEASSAEKNGYKLTLLAFVCKAVTQALVHFPQFNSSLDSTGEVLIYKKYYNIGIAVETPQGLVVAVIKDVRQLSVAEIAREMGRLSAKARDKGLTPAEMSGGCFTVSSLGGIGGHAFTPIVNPPEVAILGLSRASIQPIYDKDTFVPRLLLPLSLSYDHRVIDGAEAARFVRYLIELLVDIRRLLL